MPCPRLADVFAEAYLVGDEAIRVYARRGIMLALELKPPIPPTRRFYEGLRAVEVLVREGRVAEAVSILESLSHSARLLRRAWLAVYTLLATLASIPLLLLLGVAGIMPVALLAGIAGYAATWVPRWCLHGLGGEEVGYAASSWEREL